jgi:hypothetical protein
MQRFEQAGGRQFAQVLAQLGRGGDDQRAQLAERAAAGADRALTGAQQRLQTGALATRARLRRPVGAEEIAGGTHRVERIGFAALGA